MHQNKRTFSLIELMTVILVILLLVSLLIPIFETVKMNARNALCKNQLRQIGVFLNSYVSDNGGYLPNDRSLDLGSPASYGANNMAGNTLLYEGWNGHLLPYIDSFGTDYTKRAALLQNGVIKSLAFSSWYLSEDVLFSWDGKRLNWGKSKKIIEDSIIYGGDNELKVFICPEIHANTYDIDYSTNYNGKRIPRITQLGQNINWDPAVSAGLPTTYLANSTFFGCDNLYDYRRSGINTLNSLKIDEISSISKKAMIVEGGRVVPPWPWVQTPYYDILDLTYSGVDRHRLSYVHDVFKIFWIIKVFKWHDGSGDPEMENVFNLKFKGKAEMIIDPNPGAKGFVILSNIDPFDKPFDKFLLTYGIISSKIILVKTVDFPEFHYMTGSQNVLFGDGAVQTNTTGWLSQNRSMISNLSSE